MRMQTQFYTGSTKSVPTSSTQATHLRFSFIFVNSFTTSEPHRDNLFLVFRNSCNLRYLWSLNQSLCIRRKKRNSLLKKKDITIEVHGWTLNGFASVFPIVSFERAFGNEILLESLSFPFERIRHFEQTKLSLQNSCPSHLVIGLWWSFTNSIKRCDCWQIFWKLSTGNRLQCLCNRLRNYNLKGHDFWIWILGVLLLVIDYRYMVIDYMFKISNSKPFSIAIFHSSLLVIYYISW